MQNYREKLNLNNLYSLNIWFVRNFDEDVTKRMVLRRGICHKKG